jgi:Domain of unknown function (DUF4365)
MFCCIGACMWVNLIVQGSIELTKLESTTMAIKKRTKSQSVGARGENAFRHIASSIGLLATKVEEDFGIDFLCQIERRPDQIITEMTGAVLGVAVRATATRRGRIRLSRDDVETLLNCQFPVMIALVHLSADPSGDRVYLRLIDVGFSLGLAGFLLTGAKHMSFKIKDFHTIEDALRLIAEAVTPGFTEQIRLSLTQHDLARVLPNVHLKVQSSPEGHLSLIMTSDFLSQFDTSTEIAKDRLHAAIFGSESHLMRRMAQVPLKKEVWTYLNRLPQPVVIAAPVTTLRVSLIIEGMSTRCDFNARSGIGYTGFVHDSGFSIRISEARPHDGLMVHYINAVADSGTQVKRSEHLDLWTFLADCAPNGRWKFEEWPWISYSLEESGDLYRFAFLAYYLRETSKAIEWPPDAWRLDDAESEEGLNTLALAAGILSEPELLSGFAIVIVDPTEAEAVPVTLALPVCSNLPRSGLVLWIEAEGKAFLKDGHIAGVNIGRVSRVTPEFVDAKFAKSSSMPELVISSEWPTVVFGQGPELTTSDASVWGYETRVTMPPPSDEHGVGHE